VVTSGAGNEYEAPDVLHVCMSSAVFEISHILCLREAYQVFKIELQYSHCAMFHGNLMSWALSEFS
jgi:hypothetical protein